jgi:hypothetical protein
VNLVTEIASLVTVLGVLGTGMYRLGSGLVAMAAAIKELKASDAVQAAAMARLAGTVTGYESRIARIEGQLQAKP